VLCGQPENIDEILFECSLSKFLWSFLFEALSWAGYPRNMDDQVLNWLPGGFRVSYQIGLTCFTGVA
jgi:hypothetical protein